MNTNNPVKQERLNNLKKAKALPLPQRIMYYLDYFKIPLMVLFLVSVILFFFVKEVLLAKEVAINVTVIGRNYVESDYSQAFIDSYINYAGIDSDQETVLYDPDFQIDDTAPDTIMKLVASVAAHDQDIIICNKETFDMLCQMSLLYNLSVYEDANADSYKNLLISYDHTQNDTPDDDSLGIQNYGIDISGSVVLKECNFYNADSDIILAIGNGSKRTSRTNLFIEWILGSHLFL